MAAKSTLSLLLFCAVSTWAYPAILDTFGNGWIESPGVDVLADDTNVMKCSFGAQLDPAGLDILGTERDIETCGQRVDSTNSAGTAKIVVQNSLAASADSNVWGKWTISWDGTDNDPSVGAMSPPFDLYGATSCDFGGANERTIFTNLDQQDFCHEHEMRINDADGNVCTLAVLTPRLVVELGCFAVGNSVMRYPLSGFTLLSGTGGSYTPEGYPCDFSRVTAVQIIVDAFTQQVDALDFVFDIVSYGCCFASGECDDGSLCTTDSCVENECIATPIPCDDTNECTSDSCNEIDGTCTFTDISATCDDTDDCTDDSCDPVNGCTYVPGESCDDSDECTDDFCAVQGGCQNVPFDFDDTDECTTEICDPAVGPVYTPVDCDDDDECTTDSCDPAIGCSNDPIDPLSCDDVDICTVDSCDPVAGCVNTPVDGPAFCDDTDVCTVDDCIGGACVNDPINCDDTDMCTEDSCDPVNGCENIDIFLRGDCDDSNDCTTDSCDPAAGCLHIALGCDDSDHCTLDDCDINGGCTHDPVICDDTDVCTDDFCDAADGTCATSPSAEALGCDDSNPCSEDSCDPVSGCGYDHSTGICIAECSVSTSSSSPYYIGDPDTLFEASISFTHQNPTASTVTYSIDVTPAGLADDVFVDPPFPFDTPGQSPAYTFDIDHLCVNATLVTIEICVLDEWSIEICCEVVVFCEDSPLCPEVCEEEAKTAICYPDEDDHLNLICAHNDDLDEYYANGGFNPSLTEMYDCNCNPITPSPTSEPTAIPTADPTAIPTSDPTAIPTSDPTAMPTPPPFNIPTADPTAAPTPPPPTPQTPIPSPAPCMYEVPDLPGYIFQCIMDSNYNVDLAVVNATDDYYLDWLYDRWDLGESVAMLTGPDNLVWYDCWCHAQCPEDHFIIPKLLLDHSYFYGGVLRLVVAIPLKFDDTAFYFQDAHSMLPLSNGACPDGNLLDPTSPACPFWTRTDTSNTTEEFFRHNCYDAYIVEIPLELLTPEMDVDGRPPHVDGSPLEVDGWEVTYCGVLVSESVQGLGFDIRGIDRNYWFRANYRYCITFPLQVEAHVEDIRVYDEVNKLDELVGAAVYVTGYEWGFSYGGMAQTWGEVRIQTSVQWPFRLEVVNQFARTRGDLWVSYTGEGPGSSCDDPMIYEYGDEEWLGDAGANKIATGNYVPFPCIQEFDFTVLPLTNTSCNLDDYIDVEFAVSCQPSYASNCPLDERYYSDPLMCTFWLTTENYCDIYERTVEVDASMDSYDCADRDCECTEENFIQDFVNQFEEYAPETVFFEVNINSDEPLAASELHSVMTELTCYGGEEGMTVVHEMITIYDIWAMPGYWAQISGAVNNYPLNLGCDGTDTESTVQFEFNLPQDVFDIPFDDSCQLSVWVVIDLFYCGVTRPDGLTPNGPTPCLLGSKLLEKEESKPELLQTETGGQSNEEAAFGISRSLRVNSFLTVGGRGEVQQIIVDNNDEVDNAEQPRDVTGDKKASALRAVPVFALLSLLLALL